ncbi:hypothetical protein KIH86_08505 [Paenibacillus sp. HN-1]|nr:hypothetical protein [Paenibacillus sp. CGMCC 1.18879]MBY9079591.1 hypothetical protein [Paenibacillus sp. CGMCC 1.18879]MBY9084280.1 hypothetical protein [Paenibacillus sinensis]
MKGLIFIVILLTFAVLWFRSKRKKNSVQELLSKETVISMDGLVQNGNEFSIQIEVQPANLENASNDENKAVWLNFLGMINTIGLSYSLIMQSQLFEMKDYTSFYREQPDKLNLPQKLRESGRKVADYLEQSTEEDRIRHYKGYVILRYNAVSVHQTGVQTGNATVDGWLGRAIPAKERMTDAEKADLAGQMLEEAADMVYGFCEQANMQYQRLDRAGIWNYTYQTVQRDLSPYARMMDAIEAGAFQPEKRSLNADWKGGDAVHV